MRIDIISKQTDFLTHADSVRPAPSHLSGYEILVNGQKTGASVDLIVSTSGERTVKLDGVPAQAVVYRDGVIVADTTEPPLRKRGTT